TRIGRRSPLRGARSRCSRHCPSVRTRQGVAQRPHWSLRPQAWGSPSGNERESQPAGGTRLRRVAEADLSAAAQNQLFTAHENFLFTFDGHIRSVRALIDENELVAAALDARVHPRGHLV